jgi:hypothetical protein
MGLYHPGKLLKDLGSNAHYYFGGVALTGCSRARTDVASSLAPHVVDYLGKFGGSRTAKVLMGPLSASLPSRTLSADLPYSFIILFLFGKGLGGSLGRGTKQGERQTKLP